MESITNQELVLRIVFENFNSMILWHLEIYFLSFLKTTVYKKRFYDKK